MLSEISYFATYNRFATAILFLAALWYVLPKARGDGVLLGYLLTALIFIKITAAIAMLGLVVAAVLLGRARPAALFAMLLVAAALAGLVELATGGLVSGYLHDIASMSALNRGGAAFRLAASSARNWLPLVVTITIVVLAARELDFTAAVRRPLDFVRDTIAREAFVVDAALLVAVCAGRGEPEHRRRRIDCRRGRPFPPEPAHDPRLAPDRRSGTRRDAGAAAGRCRRKARRLDLGKGKAGHDRSRLFKIPSGHARAASHPRRLPADDAPAIRMAALPRRDRQQRLRSRRRSRQHQPGDARGVGCQRCRGRREFSAAWLRDQGEALHDHRFCRILSAAARPDAGARHDAGDGFPAARCRRSPSTEASTYLADADGVFFRTCVLPGATDTNPATFRTVLEREFTRHKLHPCWDFYSRTR